jgi:FADH2 O2-dependent halogenase
MNVSCDIAIIGSGFAGSLLAMIAQRLGRSALLIERGRHPRFAMGESSTPLANLLLEELASRYDLPQVALLSKWGTWQRHHPDLACGLKRGFTFFHHDFGEPFRPREDRANELLVGASPHDEISDALGTVDFDLSLREGRGSRVEYLMKSRSVMPNSPTRLAGWRVSGRASDSPSPPVVTPRGRVAFSIL